MAIKQKTTRSRKPLLIVVGVLVVALAGFGGYTVLKPKPVRQDVPKSTITKLEPSSSTGEKTSSTQNGINKGSAKDTDTTPVTTSADKWTSSASGAVVVQAPLNKSTLASGFTLSGTTTLHSIQYRLIDNDVGVISEGPLKVDGGKFSAAVNFQKRSSNGRLDVFATDSSGKETDEVQLAVSF